MLNHWLKGKNDYPVRCDLLEPILNERKDAIGWQPTDKFIYAKEIEAFSTEVINNGGRLVKVRKGAIETQSLKEDEITEVLEKSRIVLRNSDDEIVLTRFGRVYFLPGGKMENGESPVDTGSNITLSFTTSVLLSTSRLKSRSPSLMVYLRFIL